MGSLFPEGDDTPAEIVYKVHFVLNDLTICDTKNAKEGTEDRDLVTCKRCIKLLDESDATVAKNLVPLGLSVTVSVESPVIPKRRGKQILIAWLNLLPEDVSLELNRYSGNGPSFIATWKEDRSVNTNQEMDD